MSSRQLFGQNDFKTVHRFGRDLESGFVWVNTFDVGDMTSIWCGYKQSGNGRDTCIEALSQYTQTKSVWMDMSEPSKATVPRYCRGAVSLDGCIDQILGEITLPVRF